VTREFIVEEFIVELLKRHGFPPRFRDWITALLCTSSLRVLNGVVDNRSSMEEAL
jgi:hypothetical protein